MEAARPEVREAVSSRMVLRTLALKAQRTAAQACVLLPDGFAARRRGTFRVILFYIKSIRPA